MSTMLLEKQAIAILQRVPAALFDRRHSLLGITLDAVTGPEIIALAAAQIESGSGCFWLAITTCTVCISSIISRR